MAAGTTAHAASGLSAAAASRIAALQNLKRSPTPAQEKLSSNLLVTVLKRSDPAALARTPGVRTDVKVSSAGLTTVDLDATSVTSGLQRCRCT